MNGASGSSDLATISDSGDDRAALPAVVSESRESPPSSLFIESGNSAFWAFVRRTRVRLRGVAFVVGVANHTEVPILASVTGGRGTRQRPIAPGTFWVDPESEVQVTGVVSHLDALFMREVCVRFQVRSREYVASALLHGLLPWVTALCVLLALAGGIAALVATPRISIISAPGVAPSGTDVSIWYNAGGAGNASYALTDASGATLIAGPLDKARTTLQVHLPSTDRTTAYALRFALSGPLGKRAAAAEITALPSDRLPGPRVLALTVDPPANAKAARVVTVHYASDATKARVALLDDQGGVVTEQSADPSGTLKLPLPPRAGSYLVRLRVKRNGQSTESVVGVPAIGAKPTSAPRSESSPLPIAVRAAPAPIALETRVARPGGSVRIRVDAWQPGLQLTLQRNDGTPIEQVDIARNQRAVALSVPNDAVDAVVLIARYIRDDSEETFVRSVPVRAN